MTGRPDTGRPRPRSTSVGSNEVRLFALEGPRYQLCEVTVAFADLLGRTVEQLTGRPVRELVHPDSLVDLVAGLAVLDSGAGEVAIEGRFLQRDGGTARLQWVARCEPGVDLWWVTGWDAAQFERMVEERLELRARLALALGPAVAAAWSLDLRTGRFSWEPQAAEVLGTGVAPLPATAAELARALLPDDAPSLLLALERLSASGTTEVAVRVPHSLGPRHLSLRGAVIQADLRGRPRRAAGLVLDVSATKAVEEQMVRMSTTGVLDGVPNRRAFTQLLDVEWRRCTRSLEPLSVVMVDLDDFMPLNNAFGHPVGDEALRAVARTLARSLHRAGDVLARFGGQEFAVVLPGIEEEGALAVGRRLVESVRGLRLEEAPEWPLSVSVGSASWLPGSGTATAEELLGQARRALYAAKLAGKDRATLYRRPAAGEPSVEA